LYIKNVKKLIDYYLLIFYVVKNKCNKHHFLLFFNEDLNWFLMTYSFLNHIILLINIIIVIQIYRYKVFVLILYCTLSIYRYSLRKLHKFIRHEFNTRWRLLKNQFYMPKRHWRNKIIRNSLCRLVGFVCTL
jgi:hypothetical protein